MLLISNIYYQVLPSNNPIRVKLRQLANEAQRHSLSFGSAAQLEAINVWV
jgi:hypothetical protein